MKELESIVGKKVKSVSGLWDGDNDGDSITIIFEDNTEMDIFLNHYYESTTCSLSYDIS